ncbi:oxidoreductase [candidate division KSB1 bacterium]|nr:oxidoreductase [candidate division KSB1 bacterium]
MMKRGEFKMTAIIYPVIYILIVLSPLALIFINGPFTDHGYLYEMGKAFALMGFVIVGMQFILSSRRKWIERPYGLDMIFSFHKAMAVLGGILILLHPVLLSLGSGNFKLLTSLSLPWYIWLGKFGLFLILIQIIISLFRIKLKFGFEKWRLSHNIIGGIFLVGAFAHSIITSHADLKLGSLQILWTGLLVVALSFYVHHKFMIPAKLQKQRYTITDVRQEVHNVWTLEMSPPEDHNRYHYYPGQFHFIKLHREVAVPDEEHHFTVSSSPTQPGVVTSSIKESGDYTSTIRHTKKGDTVSVEAPFGRFSHVLHPEDKKFVFIAGGIGITPIMSMLRYMRDNKSKFDALLIYANHSEEDIVFRKELDDMVAEGSPKLNIVHVLDHPGEGWEGETGFVDQTKLTKHIDNFKDKAFYICCPPAMRKMVLKLLKKQGVSTSQIRVEIFSL